MISTMPRQLPMRRRNRPLVILVATTLLLALTGSALSAFVLVQGVDEDTRRASAAQVGQYRGANSRGGMNGHPKHAWCVRRVVRE